MNVTDAVLSRSSTRAFLDSPISNKLIKKILITSSRAASGGNLQPWKIFILNGSSMQKFLEFQNNWPSPEVPGYDIYPPNLKEPYRTSRYELGEQMYSILGISREDKEGRINQVMKNFNFFNAPAALFCFVDKTMGPPQWSDLGMFLQTFMLLAEEVGLSTCAQEAWAMKSESVAKFVNADDSDMLFCGLALGYKDPNQKINKLKSERRPINDWAKFV
jgi:nitroreductase